jgi:hypothetical protein
MPDPIENTGVAPLDPRTNQTGAVRPPENGRKVRLDYDQTGPESACGTKAMAVYAANQARAIREHLAKDSRTAPAP